MSKRKFIVEDIPCFKCGGKLPKYQSAGSVIFDDFINDYTITYPKNKNKKYPLDSKKVKQVISTSIAMGYDPKTALALALQETGIGRTDNNIFHIIGNFDKESLNLTGDPVEDGITIAKYKKKYANSLGLNTPELELQAFNGLGKVFRNTENGIISLIWLKFTEYLFRKKD